MSHQSYIMGTRIVGVCYVLHCTGRPYSQNTLSLCWECNLLSYAPLFIEETMVYYCQIFHWYYGCVPSS